MKTCFIVMMLVLMAGMAFAANDRPLIFGQNPIGTDVWGYDKTIYDPKEFDLIAESGGTACRTGIGWDQCQKVRGGPFDWSDADRSVNTMIDRGINPVFLFNSTPEWALPADVNKDIPVPVARYPSRPDCYPDFEKYIYETVKHFRGRVQFYEFWNEANGMGWHWDKGYSKAEEYAPLLKLAYKQVKLADPGARMSTTGIDDNGEGHAVYYLGKLYENGCKGYFDAVCDHPYSREKIDEWKFRDIRKTLDEHGDTGVDIWITEMGWTQNGREDRIAEYIKDYFDKLVNNHPSVKIATYHTALDFPGEDYGYGLLDKNLKPKVTWKAFKDYPKPARPAISDLTTTALSPTTAKVTFKTDMPSMGVVMYGLTIDYGGVIGREKTAVTDHEFKLIGLQPGKTYHIRARAEAVDYGDNYCKEITFTAPVGKAVRIVSGPTVSEITASSAVIKWITDVASSGSVQYGLDFSYGGTAKDASKGKSHLVTLDSLTPGKNYQFMAISSASKLASAAMGGMAFTTLAGDEKPKPPSESTTAPAASGVNKEEKEVSIIAAKKLSDASKATIAGIVTARINEGMTFRTYIEAADGSAGICVSTTATAKVGDLVKATGAMSVLNGERVMTMATITVVRRGMKVPEPKKVTNKQLGGGAIGLQGAVIDDAASNVFATGPNNVGLLVTTSGKTTFIDPKQEYYYIDDGSGIKDGSGNVGIRVEGSPSSMKLDTKVTVTGISDIVLIDGKAARFVRK